MMGDRSRTASSRRGMTVLGKIPAVPKPINLPSQKLENRGLDPSVNLVPKGSLTWGSSKPTTTPSAWAVPEPPPSSSPPTSLAPAWRAAPGRDDPSPSSSQSAWQAGSDAPPLHGRMPGGPSPPPGAYPHPGPRSGPLYPGGDAERKVPLPGGPPDPAMFAQQQQQQHRASPHPYHPPHHPPHHGHPHEIDPAMAGGYPPPAAAWGPQAAQGRPSPPVAPARPASVPGSSQRSSPTPSAWSTATDEHGRADRKSVV